MSLNEPWNKVNAGHIAICGAPYSGKSQVQEILAEMGYQAIDDVMPIRKACMGAYDLSWEQVSTQEGKSSKVLVAGSQQPVEVRLLMGQMGDYLEETHGSDFYPLMALKYVNYWGLKRVSFGSVRGSQGFVYKKHGAVVLEIIRPDAPISPYAFDQYDHGCIDYTIYNDGSLEDLRDQVAIFLNNISEIIAA